MKKIDIARIAHNVNTAYCNGMGDSTQVRWEDASEDQRKAALAGVNFHITGDREPSESHTAWVKQKIANGWVYGLVKDDEKKTHPCIIPFDSLSKEEQVKDFVFKAVIDSLKSQLTE